VDATRNLRSTSVLATSSPLEENVLVPGGRRHAFTKPERERLDATSGVVAGYGNPAAMESRLRGMSYDAVDVAEGPASRDNTEAVILRAAAPLSVSRDRFCLAFVG
jgi:hypothetical protein